MDREYVLLEHQTHKVLQCKLNQWRHKYNLEIIWCHAKLESNHVALAEPLYYVLVRRLPKKIEVHTTPSLFDDDIVDKEE